MWVSANIPDYCAISLMFREQFLVLCTFVPSVSFTSSSFSLPGWQLRLRTYSWICFWRVAQKYPWHQVRYDLWGEVLFAIENSLCGSNAPQSLRTLRYPYTCYSFFDVRNLFVVSCRTFVWFMSNRLEADSVNGTVKCFMMSLVQLAVGSYRLKIVKFVGHDDQSCTDCSADRPA